MPGEVQAALDAAACGLAETDGAGAFLRVNRTFCHWVGQSADALIGRRRLQDLLTVGGRIFHQTHWAPLLQMQGSVSEVKLELVHADGAVLPVVLNAVRSVNGAEVTHQIAAFIARDRDKYEKELLLSRRRLQELADDSARLHALSRDRALFAEQMIGIVSHDLRNPLASIALGTALLARDQLSERQLRTLGRITRSTERATRLTGDLLDFTLARIGAGISVSLEAAELHEVVGHSVDELRQVYPGRALDHRRMGEGSAEVDANRLAQLIGNLVSNAMVYGRPDGPVTVTSDVQSGAWAISVHNDGAPIPDELQRRIFEPMTRGAQPGGATRSVGLGLFIVSEIAKAHRGTAAIHSTPDAGTTFVVSGHRSPR